MIFPKNKLIKKLLILFSGGLILIGIIAGYVIFRTWGRTVIQIDIHQDKKIIHLSNFAEPPQFAIWLENTSTKELKTVFVTHRVAKGDWEGKANVPVALPQWFMLFKSKKTLVRRQMQVKNPIWQSPGPLPKLTIFH
ncbi:MAG: hypothetical protein IPN68_03760 [Bacteroidetes bacterium]|nr:hypothetical protein [Bacteroidota bacterium]